MSKKTLAPATPALELVRYLPALMLDEVLGRISDTLTVLDRDWRILFINDAGVRIARRKRQELIGQVMWDAFPETVGTDIEHHYRQAMDDQRPETFETHYAPLDLWAEVRLYPASDSLVVYGTDISERKKAERALADSEARFRRIAETAYEGIWLVDQQYATVWANDRMCEMLGTTPERLLGRRVPEFVFPPDLPLLRQRIADRRQGIADQYDIRMQREDGRAFWALARIRPLMDGSGRFTGALGMLTDIDERKQFEQQLAAQREWFQVTLRSIGDAVIATDGAGALTFMNPVAEQLTGWSAADAAGRPLDEVFRIVHEHSREPCESPVAKVLREGKVVGLANHTALISRDGRECPIDDSGAPIRGRSGEIEGVVLVFRDNSLRAHAEQALRDSEERFRSLCACSPAGIFVAEAGRCTYANASFRELTGCGANQPISRVFGEALHPDDRAWARAEWEARRAISRDVRFQQPDGSVRWARVRTAPIHGAEGRYLGDVGTVEEVTERHRFEQRLVEADRRKDEFLAMLGHELRNPLAPIASALEIMRLAADDGASVAQAREVIARQVQHMTRLVDDLLDVSRITRGKITLRRQPVELGAVVLRAVETIRPQLSRRHQHLGQELPEVPVLIDVDATRVAQVIGNLLHNASKFSPDGATISLLARATGGELTIEVRDPGAGIPPDLMDRIFEPFVQAETAVDRAHGGLGLGLTLVSSLVKLHGGRVAARSAGLDAGSVFTVTMPVVLDARARPSAPLAVPARAPAAPARRVLVVDDNVDAAETLATMLRLIGHHPQVAHDGRAAVDQARALRPDVVLLDIGLPVLDGYEVASRLRADAALTSTRLVALSGYGQDEDRQRSHAAGFNMHLVKPVDATTLMHTFAGLFPDSPAA